MLVFAEDGKVTMEFGDTDCDRRKQRSGDGSVTKHTGIIISIDDEKCAKYDELIIHGVSRTKKYRRTPPAASC